MLPRLLSKLSIIWYNLTYFIDTKVGGKNIVKIVFGRNLGNQSNKTLIHNCCCTTFNLYFFNDVVAPESRAAGRYDSKKRG